MEQYGIKDYVVRSSTLEEVFITLREMEDEEDKKEFEKLEKDLLYDSSFEVEIHQNSAC